LKNDTNCSTIDMSTKDRIISLINKVRSLPSCMPHREVVKLLLDIGFEKRKKIRSGGGHEIYTNGKRHISIPNDSEISRGIIKRLRDLLIEEGYLED